MFTSEFNSAELARFFNAYRECALWTSTDDEGEPLDDSFSNEDFSVDCRNHMLNDCGDFLDTNAPLIRRAMRTYGYTLNEAGYDFWLTRNHHGTGFWDRHLGKLGQWLTDLAHVEGSVDLYVSDSGLIEQS